MDMACERVRLPTPPNPRLRPADTSVGHDSLEMGADA